MATADQIAQLRVHRFIAQVAGQRTRAKPAAKIKPLAEPRGIRTAYVVALRSQIAEIQRATTEIVVERLPRILSLLPPDLRLDAAADDALREAMLVLDDQVTAVLGEGRVSSLSERIAQDVSTFNRRQFGSQMEIAIGIDPFVADPSLAAQLDGFVADNVGLIKSLKADQLGRVEGIVNRGLRAGTRVETVAKELRESFGISRRRAEFIATDQVNKLNGQLTRSRQQQVGITKYRWSTSRDERVRPGHRDLQGTIQEWSKPPITNPKTGGRAHPKQDPRCRCEAIPEVSDLLEQLGITDVPDIPRRPRPTPPPRRRRQPFTQAELDRATAPFPARVSPAPTPSPVAVPKPPARPKVRPPAPSPPTPAPSPPPVGRLPGLNTGQSSAVSDIVSGVLTETAGDKQRKIVQQLVNKGLVKASFRGGVKFRDIELTPKGAALAKAPAPAPPKPKTVPPAPTPKTPDGRLTDPDFVRSLDKSDVNTLGVWKSNAGYDRLRKVQRGQLSGSASDLNHLARMDRMATRGPVYRGRMFRGLDSLDPELARAMATEGATLDLDSWTSFTSSSRSVSQFSENVGGKAWVRYSVDVKGNQVFDARKAINSKRVGARSGIKENENEVIARAGTRFAVKSSRAVRERGVVVGYRVQLEEI